MASPVLLAFLLVSAAAVTCPDGFWLDGGTTCRVCSAGKACASGATSETSCGSGDYTPGYATSCQDCPAGYYCSNPSTITICPSGSYCPARSTNHSPCQANYRCSRDEEQPCPAGTYAAAGSPTCLPCRAGNECPGSGSGEVACTGTDWSSPGATACSSCNIPGFVCPDRDKPPIRCPRGTEVAGDNLSCIDCSVSKKACNDPTAPVSCGAGQIPDPSFTICIDCPAGYECDGSDQTPCNAGTHYSEVGA